MSEIATGKLVIWLRLQAKRITPDGNRTSIMLSAAADRIEKQEAQITRLENALDTATGTAERYLRELAAEREARKAQAAYLMEEVAARNEIIDGLQKELAAAKEDLHHNDACSVCIGAEQEVCKDCDLECQTCVLDCRCKDCRDESKWEWRGAREGEG